MQILNMDPWYTRIPFDVIVVLVSSLACIGLTVKWLIKSRDKTEPLIALIGFVATLVMFFINDHNDTVKTDKLIAINKQQIQQLQDTLTRQIEKTATVSKKLQFYEQINNSGVLGDGNVVIQGNYGSTIQVGKNEVPYFDQSIDISGYEDTGIPVFAGDKVHITATGTIKVGPIVGHSGPDGRESGFAGGSLEDYNIVADFRHAVLMYKLNKADNWAECGGNFTFEASENGVLILNVNDNRQGDNSGAYTVAISKYRAQK